MVFTITTECSMTQGPEQKQKMDCQRLGKRPELPNTAATEVCDLCETV